MCDEYICPKCKANFEWYTEGYDGYDSYFECKKCGYEYTFGDAFIEVENKDELDPDDRIYIAWEIFFNKFKKKDK